MKSESESLLSHVWLFATAWTIQSVEFSRPEYWVAFPFSRGSSQHRDQTQVSCIAGRFFTSWATREAQAYNYKYMLNNVKKNVNMMIRKTEDFQKTHMKCLKISLKYINWKVHYEQLRAD